MFTVMSVVMPLAMACEAYPLIMGNFTIGELVKGVLFLAVQVACVGQICTMLETLSDRASILFYFYEDTPA